MLISVEGLMVIKEVYYYVDEKALDIVWGLFICLPSYQSFTPTPIIGSGGLVVMGLP